MAMSGRYWPVITESVFLKSSECLLSVSSTTNKSEKSHTIPVRQCFFFGPTFLLHPLLDFKSSTPIPSFWFVANERHCRGPRLDLFAGTKGNAN
jgi:hypothetical protein